jgi:hypothetical protein
MAASLGKIPTTFVRRLIWPLRRSSEDPWMCLCLPPSLTERTADDHRQPPARYGPMGSALRGRLATVLLHPVGRYDRKRPCNRGICEVHKPPETAGGPPFTQA